LRTALARAERVAHCDAVTETRVLLVEDDDGFAQLLSTLLVKAGYQPAHVAYGADAVSRQRDADVVLLDLRLPDMHGFDVLRTVRQVSDIPILVLTASGDERTVVRALELGADDHLTKPFGAAVLVARIENARRRHTLPEQSPKLVVAGDVEIDLEARKVRVAGRDVALTGREFDVLAVLAAHRGGAVSRDRVMFSVWGDVTPEGARSLSVHLTNVRRKINRPGLIVTLHGYGYRFEG
jgi:DNA-binding response OmpR family regulator